MVRNVASFLITGAGAAVLVVSLWVIIETSIDYNRNRNYNMSYIGMNDSYIPDVACWSALFIGGVWLLVGLMGLCCGGQAFGKGYHDNATYGYGSRY